MRIIAGELRGRRLEAPPGRSTRPTSDRVREALFSMLASRLGGFDDLAVADLFAGSGALGFEALSREAASACFVDPDQAAQSAIRANAAALGVESRIELLAGSALALPQRGQFDLIFADPPYAPGSGSAVVGSVAESGWLAPGGWMAVETDRNEPVDPGDWQLVADRQIGRARVSLILRP